MCYNTLSRLHLVASIGGCPTSKGRRCLSHSASYASSSLPSKLTHKFRKILTYFDLNRRMLRPQYQHTLTSRLANSDLNKRIMPNQFRPRASKNMLTPSRRIRQFLSNTVYAQAQKAQIPQCKPRRKSIDSMFSLG